MMKPQDMVISILLYDNVQSYNDYEEIWSRRLSIFNYKEFKIDPYYIHYTLGSIAAQTDNLDLLEWLYNLNSDFIAYDICSWAIKVIILIY